MLYGKLMYSIIVLLSLSTIETKSQIISNNISDSVYCYLFSVKNKYQTHYYEMELLIYNSSNENVVIKNFNKYVNHSNYGDKITQKGIFYWDLLTIYNEEPEDVIVVSSFFPKIKGKKAKESIEKLEMAIIEENDNNIVIPPNSLFVSDIYMLHPRGRSVSFYYPKGYYKLCLYHKKESKNIAEVIIKYE